MWCSTCGKETGFGVTECDGCAEWWRENPPPCGRKRTPEEFKALKRIWEREGITDPVPEYWPAD